jgi:uncharacterized protein YeaO (DUF488 family)
MPYERQRVVLKRAYEPPAAEDGQRVLVDRLWPRGVTKERLQLDAWLRDVAPSTDLRKWFNHDADRWTEFQRRYREELQTPERGALLDDLRTRTRQGVVTLVYGARDTERNAAVVLRNVLEQRPQA